MTRASLCLLLAGCFNPPTPEGFGDPSLLGPLEVDNLAPPVPAEEGDPFPESLSMVSGEDVDNDRYYAHARGWLKADSADVWASLRNLDVMADRREVDEYELVAEGSLPEFDFSYVIANRVEDLLTVNYELTWVHELQQGDLGIPERVVVRWDKTDGTGFIDLLAGSVVIRRVDAGLCEVELIEHLRAAARDEQTIEQVLADLYGDLRADVHGEPLPTY